MKLSVIGYGVVAVAGLSLMRLGADATTDVRALSGSDFGAALASLASLVLVLLSAWVLGCVALSLLSTRVAVGVRLSHAITPAFLSRALFLGAAGALAIGPVAANGPTNQGPDGHGNSSTGRVLDGLRLPDRPVGRSLRPTNAVEPAADIYIVKAGDSLWSIAARDLAPAGMPADIADATRRWYDANRALIGADPDLILPGQHLHRPAKEPS